MKRNSVIFPSCFMLGVALMLSVSTSVAGTTTVTCPQAELVSVKPTTVLCGTRAHPYETCVTGYTLSANVNGIAWAGTAATPNLPPLTYMIVSQYTDAQQIYCYYGKGYENSVNITTNYLAAAGGALMSSYVFSPSGKKWCHNCSVTGTQS